MVLELKQRSELRKLIEKHFSLSDLKTLCFDLNITYANLPGDTLRDKSRELIDFCVRNDCLNELLEKLKMERPKVNWDSVVVVQSTDQSTPNSEDEVNIDFKESLCSFMFEKFRWLWLSYATWVLISALGFIGSLVDVFEINCQTRLLVFAGLTFVGGVVMIWCGWISTNIKLFTQWDKLLTMALWISSTSILLLFATQCGSSSPSFDYTIKVVDQNNMAVANIRTNLEIENEPPISSISDKNGFSRFRVDKSFDGNFANIVISDSETCNGQTVGIKIIKNQPQPFPIQLECSLSRPSTATSTQTLTILASTNTPLPSKTPVPTDTSAPKDTPAPTSTPTAMPSMTSMPEPTSTMCPDFFVEIKVAQENNPLYINTELTLIATTSAQNISFDWNPPNNGEFQFEGNSATFKTDSTGSVQITVEGTNECGQTNRHAIDLEFVALPSTVTPLSQPIITSLEILPGGVLSVCWEWNGDLESNNSYAVRFWSVNDSQPDARFSLVWQRELCYQVSVNNSVYPEGDYLLNIAVMEGESSSDHKVIVESDPQLVNIPNIHPTPQTP